MKPTDDPHILQLDCLASDFYRDRAYPTSLCYNPHDEPRRVKLAIGTSPSDLYDAVRDEFACRNAKDTAVIQIPADSAVVLVIAPTGGRMTRDGERTRIKAPFKSRSQLRVADVGARTAMPRDPKLTRWGSLARPQPPRERPEE